MCLLGGKFKFEIMQQKLMRHHWLALHDLFKCLEGKFIEVVGVVETYFDAFIEVVGITKVILL